MIDAEWEKKLFWAKWHGRIAAGFLLLSFLGLQYMVMERGIHIDELEQRCGPQIP